MYKKTKIHKSFFLAQFKISEAQIDFDNRTNKNVLKIATDCVNCKDKFVLYGPYRKIGIGKFTAKFYLKSTNFINNNLIACLDVAVNYGTTILAVKKITKKNFSTDQYINIDLDFETTKSYSVIEFRIYYYGAADLYFDHIELKEK